MLDYLWTHDINRISVRRSENVLDASCILCLGVYPVKWIILNINCLIAGTLEMFRSIDNQCNTSFQMSGRTMFAQLHLLHFWCTLQKCHLQMRWTGPGNEFAAITLSHFSSFDMQTQLLKECLNWFTPCWNSLIGIIRDFFDVFE